MSSGIFNRMKENIIDRRLHQDLISMISHAFHCTGNCWYHTCTKCQPFPLDFKMMSSFPPSLNGFIPFIRNNIIAKTSNLHTGPQRLDDSRCCLKIHICYPHRKFVLRNIPFIRITMSSVMYPVKIVCHVHSFYCSVIISVLVLSI